MSRVDRETGAPALGPRLVRAAARLLARRPSAPQPGRVRFGDLRRLAPVSRRWGFDRGLPVDRHYIERFLAAHQRDVRGRVLEVGDDVYGRRFGGPGVATHDVLFLVDHPKATLVGDLTREESLPAHAFDCVIATQVLQFVTEPRLAIRTLHRLLAPGGVLLVSVAGISQIDRHQMERWGDYWRFTSLSLRRLLGRVFPLDDLLVEAHGNVLAATAFLYGLAAGELTPGELEHRDPDYEVVIAARAVARSHPGAEPA